MVDFDENSLNSDLRKTKSLFNTTVKRHGLAWIESYKLHEDVALSSLISLIFRACKCPFIVTIVIPKDLIWTNQLQEVEESLNEYDPEQEPTLNEKQEKGFSYAQNLSDLIEHILKEGQHDILIDKYFSANILQILSSMSKSPFRNFRHGSTLIALRMMTVLTSIFKQVNTQWSACNRQLSMEQTKTIARRSSERIETLETTLGLLDNESGGIEDLINILTKQIIHPRFRDISGEIRLICLEELQVWLNDFSNLFLHPKYLEHLRQLLCDSKATKTELMKALKLVKWIFLTCKFPDMQAFSAAIEGSIVKLSVNSNPYVCSLSIQVASAIVRQNVDFLKEVSKEFIKFLVYSPKLQVSHEAGVFLHQIIVEDLKDEFENHPHFPVLYLLHLKDFIVKSSGSEKVALLVESMLSDENNYLIVWKSYVILLLMDEFQMEDPQHLRSLIYDANFSLESTDEGIIIGLMLNSLKLVFSQESPRHEKKHLQIFKTSTKRKSEHAKVTEYILAYLPRIMRKFIPEKSKIIDLLSICSTMNFRCWRSEDIKNFGEVFQKIAETHKDFKVHVTCAKVLAYLCEGNGLFMLDVLKPFLEEITNAWRKSLKDYWIICVKKQQNPSSQIFDEKERNEIFSISNYYSVLWAFSGHFSLEEYVDLDELFALSQGKTKEASAVPFLVMEYSFKIAHAMILREAAENKVEEIFKAHMEEFCEVGSQLLQGNFECSVKHSAYMCLIENACMLRSIMANSSAWVTNCWKTVIVEIIKYFSAMVCIKGGLNHLSRKEEEESVAAYLKLIKRRVLPQQAVINVLRHHTKEVITRFTNIVKETMSFIQSWGMEDFAASLHEALSLGYQDLIYCDEPDNDKKNILFLELKELANLLMAEYGNELAKHRKAAVQFHLKGIDFATEMRSDFVKPLFAAPFAVILDIFFSIIHLNDRRKIKAHLDQCIRIVKSTLPLDSDSLDPFMVYMQNFSEGGSHKKKRKYPSLRSRRNLQEEMDVENSMEYDNE